jgi:hypothetical protein
MNLVLTKDETVKRILVVNEFKFLSLALRLPSGFHRRSLRDRIGKYSAMTRIWES